jgi:predicted N-acetyltransferase YhbS
MPAPAHHIRPARVSDLEAINRVIEAAVLTWDLPARVKRLALPACRYDRVDLEHLEVVVATDGQHTITGIAAWEPAEPGDVPPGRTALLLHGIHVDPAHQRQGIGRRLLRAAEADARRHGYDGLLVKAQAGASDFFNAQGMRRLPIAAPRPQYRNRLWKSLPPRAPGARSRAAWRSRSRPSSGC